MIQTYRTANGISIQLLRFLYFTFLKTKQNKATSYTMAIGIFFIEFAYAISFKRMSKANPPIKPVTEA
tara:strand:+ start:444 stop:647 length:204 start_codon:yes stop_codon:yes gene_type:complete